MTQTPRLGLQMMAENVLQKEVLFNEALISLDVLLGATVKSSLTAPPGSPVDGDTYIVGVGASGAWAGKDGKLAFAYNGWHFVGVPLKYRVYNQQASAYWTFQSSGWAQDPAGTPSALGDLTDVGLGVLSDGDVLTYVNSTGKWSAGAPKTKIAELLDVGLPTSIPDGAVLSWSLTNSEWTAIEQTVPQTVSDLTGFNASSAQIGDIAVWGSSGLDWVDPSSLITVGSISQVGDVVTTGAVLGDQLTWNGTAWGPSTRVTTYSFAGMVDGPGTMSGKAGQFLVVNETEDHLAYMTLAEVQATVVFELQGLDDVPATIGTAGQVLVVNPARNGFVYADIAQSVTVKDEGVSLALPAGSLNFVGETVTATEDGSGNVTVTVSAPPATAWAADAVDLGVVSAINVTGQGVSLTNAAGTLTIEITGVDGIANQSDVTLTGLTNGQLLRFDGTSSKWVNSDPSAILANVAGYAKPALYELGAFAPPKATWFPTRFGAAGAAIVDKSQRGLLIQPTASTMATQYLGIVHDLTANTVPWEVTCRVSTSAYNQGGFYAGVMVRRGANGRIAALGVGGSKADSEPLVRFSYQDGAGGETVITTQACPYHWLKLGWDGNNIIASISPDGLLWQQVGSIDAATALNGTPTQLGLYERMGGNSLAAGTGALWTYYDDPDYPAANATQQGYVNVALANLNDVNVTGRVTGSVPAWDAASETWIMADLGSGGGAGALADLTDVVMTGVAAGRLLSWDGPTSKAVWVNAPSSLPAGGTTGQVLAKVSGTAGDVAWTNPAAAVPVTTHRYWRILVYTTMSAAQKVGISELRFLTNPASPQTAPTGGTAFSVNYSVYSDRIAARAFDGDVNTMWMVDPVSAYSPGADLGYDYGSGVAKDVQAIAITIQPDGVYGVVNAPKSFDVQYSDNNTTWTTLWGVTNAGWTMAGETRVFTNPAFVPAALGLDDLVDVDLTGATTGKVLTKGASGWVASTPGGGLPTGGTTGQVLAKNSATDSDVSWQTASGGGGSEAIVGARKYWRLMRIGSASTAISIAEIAVRATTGGAVVTPTTATAYDYYDANSTPAKAIDGSASTFWAASASASPSQFFQLYFSTATTVAEIVLTARSDGWHAQCPVAFELMCSDDGLNYKTVGFFSTSTVYTSGSSHTFPIPPTVNWPTQQRPYVVSVFAAGVLVNGETLIGHPVAFAMTIPTGASGSFAKAGVAATASCTLSLKKNGTEFGTAVFAAGGTVATITVAADVTFAAGDLLKVVAPATADATLADVGVTIAGTRV